MDEIPSWAMDAGRKAIAEQHSHESLSQVVARALVAERERAAKIIDDFMAQHDAAIECDDGKQSRHRVAVNDARFLAAAIRKGE